MIHITTDEVGGVKFITFNHLSYGKRTAETER